MGEYDPQRSRRRPPVADVDGPAPVDELLDGAAASNGRSAQPEVVDLAPAVTPEPVPSRPARTRLVAIAVVLAGLLVVLAVRRRRARRRETGPPVTAP